MQLHRTTSFPNAVRRGVLGVALGGAAWHLWQRVISMTTFPPFARLIGELVAPEPGMEVYDPSAGAGMLLRAASGAASTKAGSNGSARLRLFGQEIDPLACALGRIVLSRGPADVVLARGDTLQEPAFVEGDRLRTFDVVVANPVWEQRVDPAVYRNDRFGRFGYGIPPAEYADWGWVQHCVASMKPEARLAVVLGVGALSRAAQSCGTSSETDIRKAFIEADLIEAVVWCSPDEPLLPARRLNDAIAPRVTESAIIVMSRSKRSPEHVLMIDASRVFRAQRRRPRATLDAIVETYRRGVAAPGAAIVHASTIAEHGYDLRPNRYQS